MYPSHVYRFLRFWQEVTSSLDAGVKIYSCRVDNVHADTMKMATSVSVASHEPSDEKSGSGDVNEVDPSRRERRKLNRKVSWSDLLFSWIKWKYSFNLCFSVGENEPKYLWHGISFKFGSYQVLECLIFYFSWRKSILEKIFNLNYNWDEFLLHLDEIMF